MNKDDALNRRGVIVRTALFVSEKIHDAILNSKLKYYTDLTDIIEAWDWGENVKQNLGHLFSMEELKVIDEFNDEFEVFLNSFEDITADLRENDFFYTKDAEPPEIWHKLVKKAKTTIAVFHDFDILKWEDEFMKTQ